jgi:hypothetical protein
MLMKVIIPLSNKGLNLFVEGVDHVWFEDRWMVVSWCDE